MKKLNMDNYVPTKVDSPRIGTDDPNAVETQCEKCKGWIAVPGRIYCVSGMKWCSCPIPHNHITREIREYGKCPACDVFHMNEILPKKDKDDGSEI